MTALRRAGPLSVGVEVALAFGVGAASFALVGVIVAVAAVDALLVVLSVFYLAAIAAMFRVCGSAYGIPAAFSGAVAYDWFVFPPTHPLAFPDSANLADALVYVIVGVVVGQLAAHANRRADVADEALSALAEEQAALRRVATLVAHEASPLEVFGKVAEEVARLLRAEGAWMHRYEPDGTAIVLASWGMLHEALPTGAVLDLEGDSVAARVRRTGRPARIDDYATARGPLAAFLQEHGMRSAVGCPVCVDGRLWGVMTAATRHAQPMPADAEARLQEFTDLVATAVSNVQAHADLAASRARIVAAADDERRRVVRDLHDGAQQRLVHTVVTLKLARGALEDRGDGILELITEALGHAQEATSELRELAHGILPSVLSRGGLRAGVGALASRMPVPVDIHVSVDRLLPTIEATAYFVVAEALTNVAKHSRARNVAVTVRAEHDALEVKVRDDGIGGARPDGSGLVGLSDRLAVLGGSLRVESPHGGGTRVAALIPLGRSPDGSEPGSGADVAVDLSAETRAVASSSTLPVLPS